MFVFQRRRGGAADCRCSSMGCFERCVPWIFDSTPWIFRSMGIFKWRFRPRFVTYRGEKRFSGRSCGGNVDESGWKSDACDFCAKKDKGCVARKYRILRVKKMAVRGLRRMAGGRVSGLCGGRFSRRAHDCMPLRLRVARGGGRGTPTGEMPARSPRAAKVPVCLFR